MPDGAVVFTRWMIGISLTYTIANPCVVANQATGKVKVYQAVVGGILLTILPISYIVLKLGAPAYSVFIVHFCIESIAQFARMYMLRKLISLPLWAYLRNIYLPVLTVAIISCIIPMYVHAHYTGGFIGLITVTIVSLISVTLTTAFIGLTNEERNFFYHKAMQIIKRKK